MFDVTALGEVLIDFTECGHNPDTGMALFERNPGGAPANVAAAVSRLAGTNKNEIVARLTRRPPRIYVRGNDSGTGYSSAERMTP